MTKAAQQAVVGDMAMKLLRREEVKAVAHTPYQETDGPGRRLPGVADPWYFDDQTGRQYGPFSSRQEAQQASDRVRDWPRRAN